MDASVFEFGNGGDLAILGNDISVYQGYENMPYLAMFGGNGNWWGNSFIEAADEQMSSQTEQALLNVPLNSSGRIAIENAIKNDLQFLLDNVPNTTLTVTTKVTSDDRLEALIKFFGLNFYLSWNPKNITGNETTTYRVFSDEFDDSFA